MNLVILQGRLGKDPEVRKTGSGKSVANFSIATSEKYTDNAGNKVEKTEWHRVTAWGNLADRVGQYLSKGREVTIQGRAETSTYKDKKYPDVTHYTTTIIANKITFGARAAASASTGVALDLPDDLPEYSEEDASVEQKVTPGDDEPAPF